MNQYIQNEYHQIRNMIRPIFKKQNSIYLVLPFIPPPMDVDFFSALTGVKKKLQAKEFQVNFLQSVPRGLFTQISWDNVQRSLPKSMVFEKEQHETYMQLKKPLSPPNQPQQKDEEEITTEKKNVVTYSLDNELDRCQLRLAYLQMRAKELGYS